MGARWYDAELGRWISPDTIIPDPANPQSFNRYSYVEGNPLRFVDPTGHAKYGGDDYDEADVYWILVPRSEWGALEPGIHTICGDYYCLVAGAAEGMYDPEENPDGYAYYSQLYPEDSLADKLDTIVIHHEGNFQTYDVADVQMSHMWGKGYADIGYHFIVGPDGTVYEGRDIAVRGAHVDAGNTGRIGVLLLGDFEPGLVLETPIGEVRLPIDNDDPGPTALQVQSTAEVIEWLDYKYGIERVAGHRDFNPTLCPGANALPYIHMFNSLVE